MGSSVLKFDLYRKEYTPEYIGWLYFLCCVWEKGLTKTSWGKDLRFGVSFNDAMVSFIEDDLITTDGETFIATLKGHELLKKFLYSKNIYEAIEKTYDWLKHKGICSYPVEKMPIEYFLRTNEKLSVQFDKYSDLVTAWFNRWSDSTIDKLSKVRYIKEFNVYKAFQTYYPERIPNEITLYRGIKSEYNKEHYKKYSSWSIDIEQGKRFATYHFVQHSFSTPRIAEKQFLLETKVKIEDILVFIGGEEKEAILREPVVDFEIKNLKA